MATQRDPWLDNAKFWLVSLVVLGHALPIAERTDFMDHVYDFVYQFHIPAFVLVSGYLSRRFAWTRRHLRSLVTTLLVPYVIYEAVMAWFRVDVANSARPESLEPLFVEPHWPMWFLLVLAMWRLVTPILKLHWVMVPLSVAVSLVAGMGDYQTLDINRFLGLLPFFTIGLHLPGVVTAATRSRWTVPAGLVALWGLWVYAADTHDRWRTHIWLRYEQGYELFDVTNAEGMEIRARVILIGLLGTFAVLAVVGTRRTIFTTMGASSMIVYLFHGYVVQWARGDGDWRRWLPQDEHWDVWIIVAGSLALSMLLASPPVARRLSWLADPVNAVPWRRLADRLRGRAPEPAHASPEAPAERDPRSEG